MKYKKIILAFVVVFLLCILGYYIVREFRPITIDENKSYLVTYVIDGDTFKVKIGRHQAVVRMLGIDTPETVDPRKPAQCYGKEASDQLKKLLMGKMVQLKMNPNREEKDRYGRFLAYVFDGDLFVNEFLLENGYAREYTYGKAYMYQKEFRKIENMAKETGKGLWGVCPVE